MGESPRNTDWDGETERRTGKPDKRPRPREERREDWPTPDEVAVVKTGERIASDMWARERKRISRNAAVIAAVVSAALGALGSFGIGRVIAHNSKANALINCDTNAKGRPIGNGRALVSQEILIIADDAFQQFPAQFRKAEIAKVNLNLSIHAGVLPKRAPKEIHSSLAELAPLLGYLPLIDCGAVIKG